ncbi:MAG: pyruvate phosphate dikinase PEP/pyruvate-binding protein [Coleofasciculaceae cyanobacterium SM2_1_6]|nr:pyruvate phosphate dikinase PEP/pyruvate-binding protein [Coleofasciculaceae cyanobacterium SM2_1_6]
MSLTQLGGVCLIFILCPLLGALPIVGMIFSLRHGQDLRRLGGGNESVSAAFYHGGKVTGILAVCSEAGKGILGVLLARLFFPAGSVWELIALIALVFGRYVGSKGAGTTNVVWGILVHDPVVAGIGFLVAGVGFTLSRDRILSKYSVLVLFPLLLALFHPAQTARIGAATALSSLLGWIYTKIPDDLSLPVDQGRSDSRPMFNFFRGEQGIMTLHTLGIDNTGEQAKQNLAAKVGSKAANLAQLCQGGYPVPEGWILLPGDDLDVLINYLQPSSDQPLVVRSSARGEDTETATAAGQYLSVLGVGSKLQLQQAIIDCLASYQRPGAVRYRLDRSANKSTNSTKTEENSSLEPNSGNNSGNNSGANSDTDLGMAVLIQKQIAGVFSGVAFSRDPLAGEGVAIEALPGHATRVVSGQFTPERYQVLVSNLDLEASADWRLPEDLSLRVINLGQKLSGGASGENTSTSSRESSGDVPERLIQQVAYLVRKIEATYHGIPQDVEWTYDGHQLWVLQSRPITTLLPIWTRKIAAEVIPGAIRPLTWSINRPLTCGVWGEIFSIVLGDKAKDLDFTATATLHNAHAYFNATLLGNIFLRMGLPPESLEFLTRGAKFSKPPLGSTLQSLPGLLRLGQREWQLAQDFERDDRQYFTPMLQDLAGDLPQEPREILARINQILATLKKATYYSIFSPLSFAIRQGLFKVPEGELDNSSTPEIGAVRSLSEIADRARTKLPPEALQLNPEELFNYLAADPLANPVGQEILIQFQQWLQTYGYLSEVGTDISIPTWKESPQPLQAMFQQFLQTPAQPSLTSSKSSSWKQKQIQKRLQLKGRVTTIYSQLLAQLRYQFIHLEKLWIARELLTTIGDIFYLEFAEIQELITEPDSLLKSQIPQLITQRKIQFQADQALENIPSLVFGNNPPPTSIAPPVQGKFLQGIAASPGVKVGKIKILRRLTDAQGIDKETILVVPYTDSGWSIALSRAGGIIAEVGGRLSHGAIIAREYQIPAVMDVSQAMQLLRDGQQVRLDGTRGIVETGISRPLA